MAALALVDAVLEGEEIDEVLLVPFQDEASRLLAGKVGRSALGHAGERCRAGPASQYGGGRGPVVATWRPPPPSRIAGEILDGPVLLSLARSEPAQAVTVIEVLEDLAGGAARHAVGQEHGRTRARGRRSAVCDRPAAPVARDGSVRGAGRPCGDGRPIAVTERVLAGRSGRTAELIRDSYGDSLCVNLEDFGALHGAAARGRTQLISVRGVSDLLHDKAGTDARGAQPVAAADAAGSCSNW